MAHILAGPARRITERTWHFLKYYTQTEQEALQALSSAAGGLSEAEAAGRLAQHGPNKLAEGKKTPVWRRLLEQLADPMIIILLCAAAVSAVTAVISGESFADVIIILAVVCINAVLGVYQESKAEKAIEALQQMTAATSKVLRGGKQLTLKSEQLVPGDVVVLEAGDAVPADARVLESASLKVEEAALTGESVPVEKHTGALALQPGAKDVPLGDRRNMVYMGSTVVYGRGQAVVTQTGMHTEMGKIATALENAQDGQTPLQKKLAQLSRVLTWLVLGICVFVFAFSLIRAGDFHFDVVLSTFMVAVSLAVAAIPEGLAAVVTVVLSIGVTNMSKRNAVIRRLTAVETLGCAQVICSDKTGTLTQNKMTVVEHWGDEALAANKAMADKALRVLACAMRAWPQPPQDTSPENLEQGLTFLGLAGMIDPIRPEVKAAIAECREAGIRPVMITGDHRDTAVAIARQLGILDDEKAAITGAQLDELSDEEFEKRVGEFSVYARVQPEHKVRIVNAWRKRGCVTAMTGDGVNDAPSIKAADIGVGMGITGTDVTKNVADMVLADDNFATIVGAVGEGRRIYDNIRKSIQFLLGANMSEVVAVFCATLFGFTILEPVHLLWVNLITDTLPALALGLEKAEPDVMRRPPRKASDGIFAGGMGVDIAYQGLMVAALTLAAYFIGHYMESGMWEAVNSPDGMTMAFLTLSMAEIFHAFNMRAQRKSVFRLNGQNVVLWVSMLASLVLTAAVIYLPGISDAFGFTHISLAEYAVALGLAVCVIPIVELVKACQRAWAKARAR